MDAGTLVRIDAVFEGVLGTVLVAGAASGGLGADDFPQPVGVAVVAVVGCLLLVLAVFLWRGGASVMALAVGNAVTAAVVVIWLLAADGFSTAGTWVLAVTIAGLAALAAAQAREARY
jgi:hypothetical protein